MKYERTLTTMPRSPYSSGGKIAGSFTHPTQRYLHLHHLDHGPGEEVTAFLSTPHPPPGKIGFEQGESSLM
jgi:hypothetical protein